MDFKQFDFLYDTDKNKNESDYAKILIKTFFHYSWMMNPNTLNKKEPRIFPNYIKEQCWNNAQKIPGRDPMRWRYDVLGNPVIKNLKGTGGIFSHEYDHIFPFSKGGKSDLENCQLLQSYANRMKANKTLNTNELKAYKMVYPSKLKEILSNSNNNSNKNFEIGELEMDLAEELIYGNIKKSKI